ncbi:hypothetical protein JKF63_05292 [Porcisia hertigi]|uniref:MPN domain-containing protein n=1 Tax=Porcisia hertigi TaxID=2761500 RepID=A0A836LIS5_9TRYP|nr:hypothetical protein JKF63_05292 [Porcisia hertigi]
MSTNSANLAHPLPGDSQGSHCTTAPGGLNRKLHNSVLVASDAYWIPDLAHMESARRKKPWRSDSLFFESVSVSLTATVKMFLHATRGCPDVSHGRFNWFEVMGLLIGHFKNRDFIVTDSFSLPVAASEVECSMTEASQIYMANYLEYHRRLGKAEPGCVGWYHTHPGYSCFLSGIDVATQQDSQRMHDPWLALVIDPVETLRSGQFSMRAFRTYPEGGCAQGQRAPNISHSAAEEGHPGVSSFDPTASTIPAEHGLLPPGNRVKEFGMHADRYYELPLRMVQSARDAPLWALLQRHFWSLSLSLTFPFAPSTRTCHSCSAKFAKVISALAAQVQDPCPHEGRGLTRDSSARGSVVGGRSLLYRSSRDVGNAQGCNDDDTRVSADDTAEVEQRLLAIAGEMLRARAESFSLISALPSVHTEVSAALRAVAAAARPASENRVQSRKSSGSACSTRKETSFPSVVTAPRDKLIEMEEV